MYVGCHTFGGDRQQGSKTDEVANNHNVSKERTEQLRNDIDSIRILATGYTGSGSDPETAQKIAGIVKS